MSRYITLIPVNAAFPEIDIGEITDMVVTITRGELIAFNNGIKNNGICRIDPDSTDYVLVLKGL